MFFFVAPLCKSLFFHGFLYFYFCTKRKKKAFQTENDMKSFYLFFQCWEYFPSFQLHFLCCLFYYLFEFNTTTNHGSILLKKIFFFPHSMILMEPHPHHCVYTMMIKAKETQHSSIKPSLE
jgi:hypothetical protein